MGKPSMENLRKKVGKKENGVQLYEETRPIRLWERLNEKLLSEGFIVPVVVRMQMLEIINQAALDMEEPAWCACQRCPSCGKLVDA